MNFPKLRGIMAEKGVTQKDLARHIGCSENTVGAKLRGSAFFNTDEIISVCDCLGIIDNAVKAEIFLTAPSQK